MHSLTFSISHHRIFHSPPHHRHVESLYWRLPSLNLLTDIDNKQTKANNRQLKCHKQFSKQRRRTSELKSWKFTHKKTFQIRWMSCDWNWSSVDRADEEVHKSSNSSRRTMALEFVEKFCAHLHSLHRVTKLASISISTKMRLMKAKPRDLAAPSKNTALLLKKICVFVWFN